MKIALYIEDGLEQIVLTPESETEKAILGKIHDGSRSITLKRGSFYECRGGYERYEPQWQSYVYDWRGSGSRDESTMIVLRPTSGIEAATAGETRSGSTEGEGPAPAGGDAA
jgi:hypothetical protein